MRGVPAHRFAVAPMMNCTDVTCRAFHRILSRRAILYSEMLTAEAVMHGDEARYLADGNINMPVAVQLGGSDPDKLARAGEKIARCGYQEVNLNVGCPSDRVRSGRFGACLMLEPELVGACVAAIKKSVAIPVTVKCRLAVDDQDEEAALDRMADAVFEAQADGLWVHARKAWLSGLNPKQNRHIPPLDHSRVYRLKKRLPDCFIGINGGIGDMEAAERHLEHVDGIMLGRAVYDRPFLLSEVDSRFYGESRAIFSPQDAIRAVRDDLQNFEQKHLSLRHLARHMMGLMSNIPGARRFRRALSEFIAAYPPGDSRSAAALAHTLTCFE